MKYKKNTIRVCRQRNKESKGIVRLFMHSMFVFLLFCR